MSLFNKFENRYIINGKLVAKSPIHIGVGNNDFIPTSVDAAVIKDINNKPFIPGSSLKGTIRSLLERIIATGAITYKKNNKDVGFTACNILSTPCVDDKKLKDIKKYKLTDKDLAEAIYNEQCDVCRIFGGNGFAAKLRINDARLTEESEFKTTIRDGVAIDRDTLAAKDKAKYTFECVEPGAEFNFEMVVDNLEDKYIDFLKIIINVLESGELKVGGKTSVGLGSIELKDTKIYRVKTKEELKNYYLYNKKNEIKEVDL